MGKQSPFDAGLIAALAVLIVIPAAITYLVVQATSEEPAGEGAPDRPEGVRPIPAPEATGLVRRGTREQLERQIERAKEKLRQARVQRAQDPLGDWNRIIAGIEREIDELRRELEELDK
jgi:hypothetical protein